MTTDDTWKYYFLPPMVVAGGGFAIQQVKVGRGQLNSFWVQDDTGSSFLQIFDGLVNTVVGQPLTTRGRLLYSSGGGLMEGSIGPMCINFYVGLLFAYTPNSAQTSGFVSYR